MPTPKVNLLRPMAFRPVAQHVIPTQPFQQLNFPIRWFDNLFVVWRKAEKNKSRRPETITLPMAALNEVLRAVIPDLICVNALYKRQNSSEISWLFSSQPIKPEILLSIVRAWAEVCLREANQTELQTTLSTFEVSELQWQTKRLEGGWSQHDNGTAAPDGNAFSVLPYYLTAKLTRHSFEFDHQVLSMKRYPLSAGTNGAELLAWPPIWHEEGRQAGFFSPYVNLTLQNVPFYAEPVLYVHAGTRRFVDPKTDFTRDIKSAILHTPVGWIEARDYTHSLQVANVQTRPMSEGSWQLEWDDNLAKIIDLLRFEKTLPPAHSLLGNGQNYRFDGGATEALLLHNTRVGGHAVSPGMSAANRATLLAQLTDLLAPGWQPVGDYNRAAVKIAFAEKTPFEVEKPAQKKLKEIATTETNEQQAKLKAHKPYLADKAPVRCERIRLATGNSIKLIICYQNPATNKAVLNEVQSLLGTPFNTKQQYFKTNCGLVIQVQSMRAGELADELTYAPEGKSRYKQEHAYRLAKTARVKEIAARFPTLKPDEHPVGVLFELDNRKKFSNRENTDPKQAIRQGFAEQGHLTQFLDADTKQEKNLSHRVRKAVLDLLRQWGVMPHLPTFKTTLSQPNHYLGIWIIRLNNRFGGPQTEVPVAVRISGNAVQVKSTSFDWTSYANAQRQLAKPTSSLLASERKANILIWLRDILSNLPDNTLLLTDAHNVRTIWNSIQNRALKLNRLAVDGHFNKPVSEYNGLRVVRLRQDKSNEAPLVYGVREGVGNVEPAYANGLFKMTDYVFASAGEKPTTAKVSPKSSKYGPYSTQKGDFDANPSYQVWNPRVCELTVVATQSGDDPAHWAAIVHSLRDMSLQFDDMTTLPLPLHLAEKLEEYVKS